MRGSDNRRTNRSQLSVRFHNDSGEQCLPLAIQKRIEPSAIAFHPSVCASGKRIRYNLKRKILYILLFYPIINVCIIHIFF